MDTLGIWVGAFLTLSFLSILFKENPFYRLAEHLYVGLAAGQAIVMGWLNVKNMAITPLTKEGRFVVIIPLALGILLYSRFLPSQVRWLNRIPSAFLVGVGTGLAFTRFAQSDLIGQIRGAFVPIDSVNVLVIFIGSLSTITYFFFTKEQKGALKVTSQIGRYTMMIAFGSAFSNTVMGRLSLLIGRLQYLLGDWLGILK
ncbi:MAG: hypothetical protein GX863_03855 [Firmicutes bacterium]|jgi:hypothetical protein|nr:hypothetical protein [Candidatus Fermentithermobacillaceae bacterium]